MFSKEFKSSVIIYLWFISYESTTEIRQENPGNQLVNFPTDGFSKALITYVA